MCNILRLDYCASGFIFNCLFEGVAFKKVYFQFGLESSDVRIKFRSISLSIYLILIRFVEKIIIFSFVPGTLKIFELALSVLKD